MPTLRHTLNHMRAAERVHASLPNPYTLHKQAGWGETAMDTAVGLTSLVPGVGTAAAGTIGSLYYGGKALYHGLTGQKDKIIGDMAGAGASWIPGGGLMRGAVGAGRMAKLGIGAINAAPSVAGVAAAGAIGDAAIDKPIVPDNVAAPNAAPPPNPYTGLAGNFSTASGTSLPQPA